VKIVTVCCMRNEEGKIPTILESLYDQTIRPEKIVIIDDGSTDNSLQVLKVYQKKFENWIDIIHRKDRIGGPNLAGTPELAITFNKAFEHIEHAQYEYDYLMVSGADDEYPCGYIEELIKRMKQDESIVVASGRNSLYKIYSKTSPRGAGRLIKRHWWIEYGQRYAFPSFYWETKCLMVAQMKGYRTVAFGDIEFTTRSQGTSYGHYRYGVMHRSIKYRWQSVIRYIARLLLRFDVKGAFNYIKGFIKKPERIIEEDRKLSEDFNKWLKKRRTKWYVNGV